MNTIEGNGFPHQDVAKHEYHFLPGYCEFWGYGFCVAPPPTIMVCWNVYYIPEGCVSVYSFEALSDIESADPHSTIFTVVIAGVESSNNRIRIMNLV